MNVETSNRRFNKEKNEVAKTNLDKDTFRYLMLVLVILEAETFKIQNQDGAL